MQVGVTHWHNDPAELSAEAEQGTQSEGEDGTLLSKGTAYRGPRSATATPRVTDVQRTVWNARLRQT
jgi:hypothetical protein